MFVRQGTLSANSSSDRIPAITLRFYDYSEATMAVRDMRELLKHELGDLLYAEKQVLKTLPKMVKDSMDPAMTDRLRLHRQETEQQIQNLESAFAAMGEKARGQKCPGILGIIEEYTSFKDDEKPTPEIQAAFNLGAGLRVEHYEIAAYRSAVATAKSLGQAEVANLLTANLRQEEDMARFLTTSAPRALRTLGQQAAVAGDGAASGSARKGGKKGGAKKGKAKKRSASRA